MLSMSVIEGEVLWQVKVANILGIVDIRKVIEVLVVTQIPRE